VVVDEVAQAEEGAELFRAFLMVKAAEG